VEDVNLEIIGVIAAVLTTSGFVPQVYKSFKTKNVRGISITMYVVLLIGMMFWLYYGILIESFSIKLANIISGILVISLIVLRILYRNK
jgi:MtN3 and saliva related transmembrane protein